MSRVVQNSIHAQLGGALGRALQAQLIAERAALAQALVAGDGRKKASMS